MVEVFGGGFAGVDFVFNAVQPRHQQGGKAQVGVGHGVGKARFHAARLVAADVRDADGGGAVAARVGQLHGRFKVRHQALVAVGGGVGDGVERARVLDDAADVVERIV